MMKQYSSAATPSSPVSAAADFSTVIPRRGIPMVISAPSGTGKTSLSHALVDAVGGGVAFSISHTTRAPRPHEHNGVDYHFVDDAQFAALVSQQAMLEYATVFNHRYGTARAIVEGQLHAGIDVLFDIDVQGGQQISTRMHDAVLIYILPPDLATLEARLRGRKSDSEAQIAQRLAAARAEMEAAQFYHYWVVNDVFEETVAQLQSILVAERLKRYDKAVMLQALAQHQKVKLP